MGKLLVDLLCLAPLDVRHGLEMLCNVERLRGDRQCEGAAQPGEPKPATPGHFLSCRVQGFLERRDDEGVQFRAFHGDSERVRSNLAPHA